MQNNKNPFMPFVEDFEAETEVFLRKYCKEILDSPQATPIRDIAQKQMNLDIVETESLSPDDSIQGAIAFSAGIIDVYDWSSLDSVVAMSNGQISKRWNGRHGLLPPKPSCRVAPCRCPFLSG